METASFQACRDMDAWITHAVASSLNAFAGVELRCSPATTGLPTVDSPTIMLLAASLYLAFVAGGLIWIRFFELKPRIREPWPLQAFVILHNALCLALSMYMCVGISYEACRLGYSLWTNAYNPTHEKMAHYLYVFYMSKYLEFFDTIIMLLKHKVGQVTVLHVYHHCSIVLIWWGIIHHAPGGDAYFSAALNSGVHVMMYFYYMLSAILRDDAALRHKYLFWGKYLTRLQIIQFGMNMAQAYYDLKVDAPYPRFLTRTLYYYMISLLILFSNFYLHKYSTLEKGKSNKAE